MKEFEYRHGDIVSGSRIVEKINEIILQINNLQELVRLQSKLFVEITKGIYPVISKEELDNIKKELE